MLEPTHRGAVMSETQERLQSALAGRYQVERRLGEGGMAVVYLALDLRHDRKVAIKVLKPEIAAFLGPDRFLREIHFAAQLNHPHILALHDSGEAAGLLYYVMPWVEGASLRERLATQGRLPLEEAVLIAGEVADGLAKAHSLGIVHRDIKPENILLASGHAEIADFGIARAFAGLDARTHTTGPALGTPPYMSPEQVLNAETLDHRSDIYSLGCVLFEMLTGHPPYAGSAQSVLAAQLAADTPSVRDLRPEVPEELEAVVRKAMAKDPAGRFQQAAEMRTALGLSASTGHVPLRRAHWSARRRRRTALATAAAVLLLGLGTVTWLALRPAPPPPRVATEPLRVLVRFLEDRSGGLRPAADRITEQLTDRLDSVPALQVTASALVAEVRGASLDSLLARFRPQRVVTGSVARADGRLRATLAVIDPATTRSVDDTTILVEPGTAGTDEAAAELSLFVRRVLSRDFERAEQEARVRDAQARAFVAEALERQDDAMSAVLLRLDQQGFRSLDLSDSLLREARRRDGSSDLVPVLLARNAERRAFYVEYLLQNLPVPPPGLPDPLRLRAEALEQLDRLIRERRGPADAFELRGRLREGLYRHTGADSLLDLAAADFRAATELDRHRATAWALLASAYQSLGRYDDALLAAEHAATEDVFRLQRHRLLRARFDAALNSERFRIAEEACRTGFAEAPTSEQFKDCQLNLWSRTGTDPRTAALARARADELARGERIELIVRLRELWVADVYARAGMGDSADAVAARATARVPDAWQGLLYLEAAHVRLLRGDRDSALALIGAAARADPSTRKAVRSLPQYRPLWTDPQLP